MMVVVVVGGCCCWGLLLVRNVVGGACCCCCLNFSFKKKFVFVCCCMQKMGSKLWLVVLALHKHKNKLINYRREKNTLHTHIPHTVPLNEMLKSAIQMIVNGYE